MRRTHDLQHAYPRTSTYAGVTMPAGHCRIQIYQQAGHAPLVLCTAPPTLLPSITILAPELAADVLRHSLTHWSAWRALWPAIHPPLLWIAHDPPGRFRATDDYQLVAFAHYEPRPLAIAGHQRLRLGSPTCRRLTRAQLAILLDGAAGEQRLVDAS